MDEESQRRYWEDQILVDEARVFREERARRWKRVLRRPPVRFESRSAGRGRARRDSVGVLLVPRTDRQGMVAVRSDYDARLIEAAHHGMEHLPPEGRVEGLLQELDHLDSLQ